MFSIGQRISQEYPATTTVGVIGYTTCEGTVVGPLFFYEGKELIPIVLDMCLKNGPFLVESKELQNA